MIDLDSARAARREAGKKGPVVKVEGKQYELPIEMPYEVLEAFRLLGNQDTAAAAMPAIAEALLGKHYGKLRGILSVDDLEVLTQGLIEEYGVPSPSPSSDS